MKPHHLAFMKAYSLVGSVTKACEVAEHARSRHYQLLKENKDYRDAFAEARNRLADVLEAVVIQRAVEGYLEPVYYKGKPCGAVRRFSDGNAQFMLRGLRPDVYRERSDVNVKAEVDLKFKGELAELLDVYRQLTKTAE